MQRTWWRHIQSILLLPFNVLIVIPLLLHLFTKQLFDVPKHGMLQFIGIFSMTTGLILLTKTILLFKNDGEGTLAPWDSTRKLVISGPYKYCRNPMISGVLSILIGEALLFSSANTLLWGCFFFFVNHIYFIFIEEPVLEKKFGESYKLYKSEVPRWIPRIKNK